MKRLPDKDLEAELRLLFSLADGRERFLQLLTDLDDRPPQSLEFFVWFLDFCTERLSPTLWADKEVLRVVLLSDLNADGMDVLELLRRACAAEPFLRRDFGLLVASLGVSLGAVTIFDVTFLEERSPKDVLIVACRGYYSLENNRWSGATWPLSRHPTGFLSYLPSSYLEKSFLIEAASYVHDEGTSFDLLPLALKADRDVALAFADKQCGILRYVPTSLFEDKDLLRAGLSRDPQELENLPRKFWEDEDLLPTVVASWGASFFASPLGAGLKKRKDLMLLLASECFDVLLYAAPELAFDEDLVEAAMTGKEAKTALATSDRNDTQRLKKAWDCGVALALKSNPVFLKRLLSQNGRLLFLLERHHRSDRSLVTEAVRHEGAALKDADPSFWSYSGKRRKTEASEEARTNDELLLAKSLIQENRGCWSFLPKHLRRLLDLEDFECCVCYDLPKEEIRQCLEGTHLICSPCANSLLMQADASRLPSTLPVCPVCRGDVACFTFDLATPLVYGARNRLAERELAARIAS